MFGAVPQNTVFYPAVSTSSISQLVTPPTTPGNLVPAGIPSVPNTAIPLIVPPPPPSYAEAVAQQQQNNFLTALASATSPDLNELSLQDYDEEADDEQPLDLSLKRPMMSLCEPSTSVCSRPSVIRGSLSGIKSHEVKRSASSVSYKAAPPEPDVSEHFRRSLSGKWPRRQNFAHYTPPSFANTPSASSSVSNLRGTPIPENGSLSPDPLGTTLRRKISSASLTSNSGTSDSSRRPATNNTHRVTQIIINEGQVEDHFRKALGEEKFRQLREAQKNASNVTSL
ncbi:hypothetical protein AAVH_02905 [Aphelenchoides avenae]|nr:hypothetical protein AAVH_02905 [Aphelenchus avenae]